MPSAAQPKPAPFDDFDLPEPAPGRYRGLAWGLFLAAVAGSLLILFDSSPTASEPPREAHDQDFAYSQSESTGGVTPRPVTPAQGAVRIEKLNLSVADDGQRGARVIAVGPIRTEQGVAWLSQGDVVVRFNTHSVSNAEDLAARVGASVGRVSLDVIDGSTGQSRSLFLQMPQRDASVSRIEYTISRNQR